MAKDASFFGLNRPEYIPSRELFMSELAWSLAPGGSPRRIDPEFGPAGLAYADLGTRKNPGIESTRPVDGDERFEAIVATIKVALRLRSHDDAKAAAAVLLTEIEAPSSAGATRSVATPLTLEAALLQDRRGVTGKNNPANIALILEQMYALGGGNATVALRWAKATVEAGPSGLPGWVGKAMQDLVPEPFRASTSQLRRNLDEVEARGLRRPMWLTKNYETPFHWFADAWDRLCTDGWIDSMPRRRWTDWAACVARTAIATGYMFEMHLARRMLSALASREDPGDAVRDALADGNRLLTWDDRLARSAADIGPTMSRLAATGTECISLLVDLVYPGEDDDWDGIQAPSAFDHDADGLSLWVADSRARLDDRGVDVRELVSQAMDASRTGSANNTWETIRYSLLDRSESGAGDLYALLRSVGKYTWVEPGQEWLVTVASLQARGPKSLCRLTDLQEALSSLGIEASQQTLVSRLEGFGLARSSHDADDALEITAGF
jgi:hypothetical protein